MATKGRITEEYTKYKIHTNLYKVKKHKTNLTIKMEKIN